jgi:hypothetical protein
MKKTYYDEMYLFFTKKLERWKCLPAPSFWTFPGKMPRLLALVADGAGHFVALKLSEAALIYSATADRYVWIVGRREQKKISQCSRHADLRSMFCFLFFKVRQTRSFLRLSLLSSFFG